jgi:molybdenum cofactor cytidylyltransferase
MAESESTRLEVIVLAAGAGRRFAERAGGRKLLAAFEGRPLIAGALDTAFAAPARRVFLVTDGDPDVAEIAHAEARGRSAGLEVVVAAQAAEGMGASLRTAIAALPPDTDGAFVFLGDMPHVPSDLAWDLAEALREGMDAAAPRFEGRRGHPVLFGKACFPALLALTGDVGARDVLAAIGDRLALVERQDPGVLFDIDRPEDMA